MPSAFRDPYRLASNAQKASIYARDGGRCVYCTVEVSSDWFHADHEIAYSRGGTTSLENLVTACEPCNLVKGRRTAASYRYLLKRHGLEWRDEEYRHLLDDEYRQLKEWDEKIRQAMEEAVARDLVAARLARVASRDAAIAGALSYARSLGKTTQSPTGIFARLQAETIARQAPTIRAERLRRAAACHGHSG